MEGGELESGGAGGPLFVRFFSSSSIFPQDIMMDGRKS